MGIIATERLLDPQSWPVSAWVLIVTALVTVFFQVFVRPGFAPKSPKWFKAHDWPILGALAYYPRRADYFAEARKHTPTGNFSFYIGKKHIVGMSGPAARKTFYDNRELDFGQGFAELLVSQPSQQSESDNFSQIFSKNLLAMLKKENFVKNLGYLTGDTRKACENMLAAPPSPANPKWRVIDPFDVFYRIVYQLTMRTVGANDIAEDPEMLKYTLGIYESFERSGSTMKVVFPWLPTPNHLRRLYNGACLAAVFKGIIDKRLKTGVKGDDALQFLLDQGMGIVDVTTFQIGALFAGQINSGINAAWVPVHLTQNPEWMARVREEVDASVAKHRSYPDQPAAEALGNLTIDDWESEFPLIDLCLRESIRVGMPGSSFRKNVTGHDIKIDGSDEVIPNGAFAAYQIDDVHMNKDIYTDPQKFDPGRYLEGRAEDKKVHFGYLGWGVGRHPCLGMKFAKLEMALITAYFVAMCDWEMSDANGNPTSTPPAPPDRNKPSAQKPAKNVYIRYKARA